MVAGDRGEGHTGQLPGQIGERADIAENAVDEYGATPGCLGCLESGVTSTEACHAKPTERLLSAPEYAKMMKVSDEKRRGLPGKLGACAIADVGDRDTSSNLPVFCQACGVQRSAITFGGC